MKLNPIVNGPLKIEVVVEFHAANGSTFVSEIAWLRRCGHSSKEPFCDGTHKKIGFRTA